MRSPLLSEHLRQVPSEILCRKKTKANKQIRFVTPHVTTGERGKQTNNYELPKPAMCLSNGLFLLCFCVRRSLRSSRRAARTILSWPRSRGRQGWDRKEVLKTGFRDLWSLLDILAPFFCKTKKLCISSTSREVRCIPWAARGKKQNLTR